MAIACWKAYNRDMKFIAEDADVIGNVIINDDVSIYYHTTIRTEADVIEIGKGTNIQDNCVIHTDKGYEVHIGEYVTIGHSAIVHGCSIGDETIVGMGSIIMNGAEVGRQCMIGAGTLVTEGKKIPDGSLVMGSPFRIVRTLSDEERKKLKDNALHYIDKMK